MGTFHIGNAPGAIATDGQGTIWVSNPAESMVSKLTMEGTEASTFPVGNSPEPVIWDGDNLWVGNSLSHTISKMNLQGEELEVYESFGREPNALVFDGENIWSANQFDHNATRISREGELLGTYAVSTLPLTLVF